MVFQNPLHIKRFKVNLLFLVLGLVGSILILSSLISDYNQKDLLTIHPVSNSNENIATFSNPKTISIPSLQINLSVTPSQIVNGTWEIPRNSAGFLATSAKPGANGNIIIYGHNKNNILGNLKKVTKGDMVEIETEDRKVHVYIISGKTIVDPKDIALLSQTGHEVLTIHTCTGFLDSKRLIITAEPLTLI